MSQLEDNCNEDDILGDDDIEVLRHQDDDALYDNDTNVVVSRKEDSNIGHKNDLKTAYPTSLWQELGIQDTVLNYNVVHDAEIMLKKSVPFQSKIVEGSEYQVLLICRRIRVEALTPRKSKYIYHIELHNVQLIRETYRREAEFKVVSLFSVFKYLLDYVRETAHNHWLNCGAIVCASLKKHPAFRSHLKHECAGECQKIGHDYVFSLDGQLHSQSV
jgi:hypothetical protein